MSTIIKIEKLNKSFGKGDAHVQILHDIDLEINAGEFVVFFGPSGCGKSTLLNCVAGLEVPDSGKVIIRGEDLSKLTRPELAKFRNKKIGIVFQQFNVIKSFNVLENIALPQTFSGISKKRRLNRANHLLKMFGLEKLSKRIPTEISGGQQQRIAIARALVNNPWIIIADEPTGNLDSKSAEDVMTLLDNLNKKSRRTIIMVTHNSEHLKYAHKIFYLKDGQIINTEIRNTVNHEIEDEPGEIEI